MVKDVAQSVRARLLNKAKESGEDYNTVLIQYALQRFLYRLSVSEFADQFLLKGSWLFVIWHDSLHRPTRDVDLLGFGSNDVGELLNVFVQVAKVYVEKPDGLTFDSSQFKSMEIKKEGDYQGVRISGKAKLGNAIIPLQIDIGFGDAVTPTAEYAELPGLLDFPNPNLKVYPVYTVISEKFHAMVFLGLSNSRMKDFYDLLTIAQTMSLSMGELQQAIMATFDRRGLVISDADLMIFTELFKNDADKNKQWNAFKRKNGLPLKDDFAVTIDKIQGFLEPVYQHIALDKNPVEKHWDNKAWFWKDTERA
ncbi:nucleotidyl transferase AbiEii/AbiGii toxin family protein [Marinicella sp. S1101]|uniref:nucleotidyl transferase AbiEii/AbiGii toxin family protein n=1 Tax=Marinicella marina TaxID=2996016 RepID=UPI002260D381|nr:nucleotidyl transferase AbiEii/AbiGii toxin family protein [Marinicella marina]MCX7554841.1 nucleotidyl transferase AbiEii/AbiGii toxin family protein [Marinicella marina]MDJ1141499.1 nucleotidyl transferase AbiEii/AbiGii toxin family protein [Marinicella marina]